MESIEIKDVPDFISRVSQQDLITGDSIFRGQSTKGNLLPGVARRNPRKDSTAEEISTLQQFRKHGLTKFPGFIDLDNEWDLLVLAQHYGLKTRLLDWSHNALAALWFACSSRGDSDGFVYMLDAHTLMLKSMDSSPFSQKHTRVITPNLSNDRIIAQSGCFTVHKYSEKSAGFVPLEKNSSISRHLTEYVIPGKKKKDFLMALERCGVSSKSIYPDINGLCQFLNWRAEGSY